MSEITNLRRILPKASAKIFLECYKKLVLHDDLGTSEIGIILNAIAVFLFSGSIELQKMAYYMAVHLGAIINDYSVLYDISNMLGYYPVAKLIEKYNERNNESAFHNNTFNDSIVEESLSELCKRDYYQSKQQYNFAIDILNEDNLIAIAPTSYGKSSLMIEKCLTNFDSGAKICILVPTKSLLRQTLTEVIKKKGDRKNVITHPDMFTSKNVKKPHIAILTQERLMASLMKWDELQYDYLMVDECHNLFRAEERSLNLARSIIIAGNRNDVLGKMDYYSPFVVDPESSLSIVGVERRDVNVSKINESMKIPEFFVLDSEGKLSIYDQFLDDTINTGYSFNNSLEIIEKRGALKNIIYSNRPCDVERIADEMASRFGTISFSDKSGKIIEDACKTLKSLIGGEYNVIRLLKCGIAISHGKMLDVVKDYIEKLYRELPEIRYMITTSTLLEGINIPAEKMFILSYSRGRNNLDRSSFQNLIGRVGRFNNIFGDMDSDPRRLISEIYVLKNDKYMRRDASPVGFLKNDAKEGGGGLGDSINNYLLAKYNKDDKDERLGVEITKLYNMDPLGKQYYDSLNIVAPKMAVTDFGRRCFKNGVSLFNVIAYEDVISKRLGEINEKINNADNLMDVIVNCILKPTYNEANIKNNQWVYSLCSNEALNTVVRGVIENRVAEDYNIAKLIVPTVSKWKKINGLVPVYVGDMGDCMKDGSTGGRWLKYHIFNPGERNLMFSYAVGLAKENLDKLEFCIMPLVETLNDLGYVDETFYRRLKYGTDDEFTIGLLRLGFDISLAKSFSMDEEIKNYFGLYDGILECKDRAALLVKMVERDYSAMFIDEVEGLL